ncbi:aspartyl/asparaginyl beta-hydroxylase domain-containing protein [Marinimicrobium locisalis]|uniref:aspartyl/asparaginyl beta-hydroxylase domain-containing protein n=1 Tax=Marinimicrobium locisalis TaxID=546022 RepID=UPI0032222128
MDRTRFFEELLAGDQHRGGIRCLEVFSLAPRYFSELQREVSRYRACNPASVVSDEAHVTNWVSSSGQVRQYSLLNDSGRSDDFSSDHNLSCRHKWFFDEPHYPVLGQFINDWPDLVNFRITTLGPGAALSPHEECLLFRTQSGGVGARLRFHLPIDTNPSAEVHLDGDVYHLREGMVYLFNQGCVHSARNLGPDTRVHLVWDSLLTTDLLEWLLYTRPSSRLMVHQVGAPTVLRKENPGAYRRLAPVVPTSEAHQLDVCQRQ